MDPIDKLLAQIKAEYEEPAKVEEPRQQKLKAEPLRQPPPKQEPFIDSLLTQLKAEYEEQARIEEQLRQQQLKAEQLRQQQLRQQQLEALTSRARVWLEKLDPLSSEGIWFEKFAEKYSSKLAAAIDYLQDCEGTNA